MNKDLQDFPPDEDDDLAGKNVALQLLQMRKKLGLSQEDMSAKFKTSVSSYKRWEIDGPKKPTYGFWRVYFYYQSKTTDELLPEHGKSVFSLFNALFKSSKIAEKEDL